jgi:hypothetical protein
VLGAIGVDWSVERARPLVAGRRAVRRGTLLLAALLLAGVVRADEPPKGAAAAKATKLSYRYDVLGRRWLVPSRGTARPLALGAHGLPAAARQPTWTSKIKRLAVHLVAATGRLLCQSW